MAETKKIILDDTFVIEQMGPVATGGICLLEPAAVPPGFSPRQEEKQAKKCRRLFCRHHGISEDEAEPIPLHHLSEFRLLNFSLDIIGKVLNLESGGLLLAKVIEVDWKAHTELLKQKRYRDHITHPVRVAALGWWLLHRNHGALLKTLAAHYRNRTRSYRRSCGIVCRPDEPNKWERIIEYAWLAAALLHDSAYPLEYHLRAAEGLCRGYGDGFRIYDPLRRRFTTRRGRSVVLGCLAGSWFLKQALDIENRMAELGGTKQRFEHAHAITGALHHLMHLGPRLVSFQGLVVQMAARAMVSHHDQKDRAIKSDPLALLLFVADNLQAWGRPFLHREVTSNPGNEAHRIRPLVECERIRLDPDGNGYLAKFQMNLADRHILQKEPYSWNHNEFCRPYRRLESLLRSQPLLPQITLTGADCIEPISFRRYRDAPH